MKLAILLSLSIILSGCATRPSGMIDIPAETKSISFPKAQLVKCSQLPMLEPRLYSDTELLKVLNDWVTVHESCASNNNTLINTLKATAGIKLE